MKKLSPVLKKLKKFFKNKTFKIFIISFVTMIFTILVVFTVLWGFRNKILSFIASNYILQSQSLNNKPILIEKIEEVISPAVVKEEVKAKEEGTVVSAVKKAKPAVVSIVISKEVPKYDITYEEVVNSRTGEKETKRIRIENGTEYKPFGSGSGFLVSHDGYIVTNRHVVDKTNAKFTVLLNSGIEYNAKVLALDPVLDVAILKIESGSLPYLELSNSDDLQIGQSVVAIGNSMGEFKNTVSVGVVSGLSRSLLASSSGGLKEFLYKVIQTDAAINPGNSGGPLLNLSGDVVGINVAVAEGSSNIGFSLPINSVKDVISQVKKTGKIIRPYIGIRYIPVNESVKAEFGLLVNYGILIQKGSGEKDFAVIPGSPAEKAGLLEGDIILDVDNEIININNDFMSLIRSKKIGDKITLKVLSKTTEKNVTLKLEELPESL